MTKQDFKKVYRVQILGVNWESKDKSFDGCSEEILESSAPEEWVDDYWKALSWFESMREEEIKPEWFDYDEVLIQLQYGEINIPQFEANFDCEFDLDSLIVQDSIPYELDWNWNNVHEVYREVKMELV